jgi:predicted nucleic acid-binding protein
MKTYVLDANAVLDYSENAPGGATVERILGEALRRQAFLSISVVNWGEVFYFLWHKRGEVEARNAISRLSRLPIEIVPVILDQALKAAELKAIYGIPYADGFAASLAIIRRDTLVTADRDFEKLWRRISVMWLARA